jgi:DDE superfamily endonuclease
MKSNIVPKASPDALPELAAFLEPFALLFRRHTSRDSMERYLTGLLTDLPHKTADTIAAAIARTSTERLQHLLTDATWDATALDEARVKHLLALHPLTAGVLVFDDTGLPKKGTESVGVAPQYSGTLGKIGNCQVVVSAEYLADDPASSTPFHWPVSAQLFLPEAWVADDERRERTHVPVDIGEQTKPAIALSLLDRARAWGVPIQAVVVDAGDARPPSLPGRARRPPGALRLCGTKHLWGALARRSAGCCSADAQVWWAWAATQAATGPVVLSPRTHRGAAGGSLADDRVA